MCTSRTISINILDADPFERTRRKTPSAYTVNDIEDIVNHPRIRARFGSIRSQKMKKSEISQIAKNFLQEKDKLRKLKYLRFFYAVKFPLTTHLY